MKKLLIAAGICMIPLIFLGMVLPLIVLMTDLGKGLRLGVILTYVVIYSTCLGIVIVAGFRIASYAPKINKLESEIESADRESERLRGLIRHYNRLIAEAQNNKF